jgi:hypothetical protein
MREDKGLQNVIAKNHTILCGWNKNGERILESLKHLPGAGRRIVVLVNEMDPEEFQALRCEPADWRPEDSILLSLAQGVLLDLGLPELGLGTSHADVAGQGDGQSYAGRNPIDCGNDGFAIYTHTSYARYRYISI